MEYFDKASKETEFTTCYIQTQLFSLPLGQTIALTWQKIIRKVKNSLETITTSMKQNKLEYQKIEFKT